ncbi:hypothetical protein ACH5RR_023211 [Cinchona calisaya]|uniref:Uncharacterized protein n=1 Tax=Cinchona calisaya TaxID=153742 RepID=A0ABD2ZBJ2_9GENT
MEDQLQNLASATPLVKATLKLGSETYPVMANEGVLSEQLVSMKKQSMGILKDYITKYNVPNDVPDEPEEISSEDEGEISPGKSKKRK